MSPAPTASVSVELAAVLRRPICARCSTPCPSASPWPATGASHADFLEMVLTDEITRRDRASASCGPGPITSTRPW